MCCKNGISCVSHPMIVANSIVGMLTRWIDSLATDWLNTHLWENAQTLVCLDQNPTWGTRVIVYHPLSSFYFLKSNDVVIVFVYMTYDWIHHIPQSFTHDNLRRIRITQWSNANERKLTFFWRSFERVRACKSFMRGKIVILIDFL